MKIAIIGARGIPNNYGGFEQFAEYLSVGLVNLGNRVTVYNSHKHPFQESSWNGVEIIHCNDPEYKYGTIGQFIYDYNCILDTRKKDYDIILQLGYTSSAVWGWLLPRKKSVVTTNMDGLEWKRTKFSRPIQTFLKYAEKLGVKHSDYLISDSVGIQEHIKNKYKKESIYIPYGSHVFTSPNEDVLKKYNIKAFKYNMLIARLESENSIEIILDGAVVANDNLPFLVIGNNETKYGKYLRNKFKENNNIQFLGGIYDMNVLNNFRFYSNIYFHGHTVGGTNPSLLEAMGSNALICANDNIFNKSILGDDAYYFNNEKDIASLLKKIKKSENLAFLERNVEKIKNIFSWEEITKQYHHHFKTIVRN